jgi:hypothetical protein
MTAAVKPVGVALMICDQVITEAGTNKKSLIGIFNQVSAKKFPCRHPRMCIFISLTGGHGKARTQIQCVNEGMGQPIFAAEGDVAFTNPNHIVEALFEFNNVTFPAPGLHCVEVVSDGQLVLQRRFVVAQLPEEEQP